MASRRKLDFKKSNIRHDALSQAAHVLGVGLGECQMSIMEVSQDEPDEPAENIDLVDASQHQYYRSWAIKGVIGKERAYAIFQILMQYDKIKSIPKYAVFSLL